MMLYGKLLLLIGLITITSSCSELTMQPYFNPRVICETPHGFRKQAECWGRAEAGAVFKGKNHVLY